MDEACPLELNLVRHRETGAHRLLASLDAETARALLHDLERHPAPATQTRTLTQALRTVLSACGLDAPPPTPPSPGQH